jgi:hypothetical protein
MGDLKELAIAYWRLKKWVDNNDIPHKMAVESALRSFEHYLSDCEVEILDLAGQMFDPGLAVEIIYCENDEPLYESKFIISEMVTPTIMHCEKLLHIGQVVIKNVRSDDV